MGEVTSEVVRRKNIQRLIGLIYDTPDTDRRRALVALLAKEEAKPTKSS